MRRAAIVVNLLTVAVAVAAVAPSRADDRKAGGAQGAAPELAALIGQVASLRGLRPKRPVKSETASRAAIRDRLLAELARQDRDELVAEGRALARFGLIPSGEDYLALFVAASVEQIAGFYDPAAKTLYVSEELGRAGAPASASESEPEAATEGEPESAPQAEPAPQAEAESATGAEPATDSAAAAAIATETVASTPKAAAGSRPMSDGMLVVAHEVAHALVDQHFGLQSFLASDPASERQRGLDGDIARRALVEGDASAAMVEMMFAAQGLRPPWGDRVSMRRIAEALRGAEPAEPTAPLWLRAHMAFPYLEGFAMVAEVRRTQSWRAVNARYRRPPLSTEHVLHPEKYDAYERPVAVPAVAVAGATPVYDTVIGELGVRTLVRHHGLSVERADEAAEGWGGDRFALYELETGGDDLGVLMTEWDTEIDASEFFAAAQVAAHSLCATIDSVPRDRVVRAVHVAGWTCTAERRGTRVLITVGAPAALADELAEALWTAWLADAGPLLRD